MSTFLETDEDNIGKSLRFLDDPMQREINKIMGDAMSGESKAPPRDFKIVMPEAALCFKFHQVGSDEKFFVNVCKAKEIPPPPDVTEEELSKILYSDDAANYRVPMSISEPRWTKDKSGAPTQVLDIAMNPQFIARVVKSQIYKDFLTMLMTEAISDKYNHQLDNSTAVLLKRPFIGSLVEHRVRNADVKAVLNSHYKSPLIAVPDQNTSNSLVTEIKTKDQKNTSNKPLVTEIKTKDNGETAKEPHYKFLIRECKGASQVIAQFYMPECSSGKGIKVSLSDDRIVVAAPKNGYKFDGFVPYQMDDIEFDATFNKISKILTILVPVKNTKNVAAEDKKG